MSKNLFNVRLFSSLLFAGALVTAGCTDNDYDFDQIDSTVGIGGEGLEIPTSSTEEIKLKDVLDLEENGSVVEDATTHDYVFRQTGDPINPVKVNIAKIHVAKESGQSIPFTFNVSSSAPRNGVRKAGGSVTVDADIYKFRYKGKKPQEVLHLYSAEASTTLTLRVPFSAINGAVSHLQNVTLSLPGYLNFNVGTCSTAPKKVEGTNIMFENVPTNGDFVVNINVTGLDFTRTNTNGSVSIDNYVSLDGKVHLTANGAITGAMSSSPTLNASFSMADFTIDSALGIFDPEIDLKDGLGNTNITGIPDFLQDENVKVDLYNPEILLTIGNDMDAAGTITGKIISKKKGAVINVINNIQIPIAANTVNKICLNRTGEAKNGYVVVKVPELSKAIETIPDNIAFEATAKASMEKVTKFNLGYDYHITPSYSIDAPLAFAENAEIVYKDTLDGWNDDLQDMELAENAYLSATANVENGVPAYLSVDVVPVGVDRKVVKGITVELVKKDVAASPNGTDKVSSPLEIKISQTEKGALAKLDGLIVTATGKAKNGDNKVTGITLNAERHTLIIKDIRIKIVGKVIGDFN